MATHTSHVTDESATESEFTTDDSDSSYSSMEEDNIEGHELQLQLEHQPRPAREEIARLASGITRRMKRMEEACGAQGFTFVAFFPGGDAAAGCSASARAWFSGEKVAERAAEAAESYWAGGLHVRELLHLPNALLGALLSELTRHCDPPEEMYPTSPRVRPPWWPAGDEEVWHALGVAAERGQRVEVAYTKVHNLEKAVKAGVLVGVVRHLAPAFDKILQHTAAAPPASSSSSPSSIQMTTMERAIWKHVIHHETRRYHRLHPAAAPPPAAALGFRQRRHRRRRPAVPRVAFTCNKLRCPYGRPRRGFNTQEELEMHKIACSAVDAEKKDAAVQTLPDASAIPAAPSESSGLHGIWGKEVAQHRAFDLNELPPPEIGLFSGGSGSATANSSSNNYTGVGASNPLPMKRAGEPLLFGSSSLTDNAAFLGARAVRRRSAPNPAAMDLLGGSRYYPFGSTGTTTSFSAQNMNNIGAILVRTDAPDDDDQKNVDADGHA